MLREKPWWFRCPFLNWFIHRCSPWRLLLALFTAPSEREVFLADGEVAGVDDFGDDVDAVVELEVDEIGLSVFHFVESRCFTRGAFDVGEGVIVVDGGDQERFAGGLGFENVVELDLLRVVGPELIRLFDCPCLGGMSLLVDLCAEGF